MTAIKGRDGEEIHEGKHDADECRHLPEHIPIPHWREKTAYGSKTSKRLGSLGRAHIFAVVNIACQNADAVANAGRKALEEAVFYGYRLVEGRKRLHVEANKELRSESDAESVETGRSSTVLYCMLKHDGSLASLKAVGRGVGNNSRVVRCL